MMSVFGTVPMPSRSINMTSNMPAYMQDFKARTGGKIPRKLNAYPSPTQAGGPNDKTSLGSGIIRRTLLFIFHPAFIVLAIMVALIAFRISQLAGFGSSASASSDKSRTLHIVEVAGPPPSYTGKDALPASKLHQRIRRSPHETDVVREEDTHRASGGDDVGAKERSLIGGKTSGQASQYHSQSITDTVMSEIDEYKRPSDRRAAISSLDDMLLDGETPVPASLCLKDEVIEEMEHREKHDLQRLKSAGKEFSEHMEDCETTDDCLQLSPYVWAIDGSGDDCRKKTYLRCDSQRKMCLCQDKFDLRWDTEVEQSTYQWNPITKTCYVRGTNPCKLDVPCSPGTVCRSTVSISYNTPPIQRICECENIEHLIYAGSQDWWYCGMYAQRSWLFDMDNIKKWKDKPFHLYGRMRYSSDYNFTTRPTEGT